MGGLFKMAIIHGTKVKLFSLNSNPELAKEIADYMGIELSECNIERFADGEVGINIPETVRGHHVFVVQSTSNPVNEHYMELLIMIDALKRASARTINIIMPYYGYSRQDRKAQSRQPISAKLIADLLTVAGATRVISLDLHAAQIQGFFDIPIDNFEAGPTIVSYLKDLKLEDAVVVSPDHGGTTRARKIAINFSAPTLSAHRLRRGLPGYLILFAPHAFVHQRQSRPSKSPSPLVFLQISTHFTAPLGIPLTSTVL
jgi:ribose-phosphate pyrophosphokinase